MKQIKPDRFTTVMLMVSLLGIILGFWGLKVSRDQKIGSQTREKVARISLVDQDVRLRSGGQIDWVKVSGVPDCYVGDRIFTGKNSTATIEFDSGSRITLLPNSMISLSQGQVSLNSGTIEVLVKKGQLGLKAFGEEVILGTEEEIRVVSDGETKKFVPLSEKASRLAPTTSTLIAKAPELILRTPSRGETIPLFPEKSVLFSWKFSNTGNSPLYVYEISASSSFEPVLFRKQSLARSLSIPRSKLPHGNLFWRVTEPASGLSENSVFLLSEKTTFDMIAPAVDAKYYLPDVIKNQMHFEWIPHLEFPQRFQLSSNPDFSDLQINSSPKENSLNLDINGLGIFYWRLGYSLSEKETHWGEARTFIIRDLPALAPISFRGLESVIDFSLNEAPRVGVLDPNKCKSYRFIVSQKETSIQEEAGTLPNLVLKPLKDGSYTLTATGESADGRTITGKKIFRVKNSPPVPPPTIKNKKNVKLFVLLKNIFDVLLPSASAAESFYTLKWDETPGATFEIEISRADHSVLVLEKTIETSYRFLVPGPEKFFWRLRSQVGNRWSAFTDYSEIEILDRVEKIKESLVISPAEGEEVVLESGDKVIPFTWKEPDAGFTYELQIFGNPRSPRPQFTLPVSGGRHSVTFKRLPRKFYWRVVAVSNFGRRSKNTRLTSVKILRKPEVPIRYQLQPTILLSRTDFNQDFEGAAEVKRNASFLGPAINVSGEYFLKRYNHHRAFAFEGRYGNFTEGTDSLVDSRLLVEFGWLSDPFGKETHNFHLGILRHAIDFKFGENLSAAYSLNFVSGKYSYIRIWDKRSLLEVTGSLLLAVPPQNYIPSFLIKPVFHQRLSRDWWAIALAMYERYTASGVVEVGTEKSDLTLKVQNISVGVGISYRPE